MCRFTYPRALLPLLTLWTNTSKRLRRLGGGSKGGGAAIGYPTGVDAAAEGFGASLELHTVPGEVGHHLEGARDSEAENVSNC